MTDLSTLKQTIEQDSTEELQAKLAEIRGSRRNYTVTKATQTKAKSVDKAISKNTTEELQELLKMLENSE